MKKDAYNIELDFSNIYDKVNSNRIVRIIQRALTIIIPILMIGSFALIIKTFPVVGYQNFLKTVVGEFIYKVADIIYNATFGMLSVYMAISISYCVADEESQDSFYIFGTLLTSVVSFAITVGTFSNGFNKAYFGVNGMFMAIVATLISSGLFRFIYYKHQRVILGYTAGANYAYNSAISSIIPMLSILFLFAVVQYFLTHVFDAVCIQEIFSIGIHDLFCRINNNFLQGLLFVLFSSILWFFGIHGSDVLNSVNDGIFTDYIKANVEAAANGLAPKYIVSKTFIDVFVLMGGCGTAICFLIAILLFCKKKNIRRLGYTAAFPMFFNINEIMVFGFPIILNPVLLIPFILTPTVIFLISYSAIYFGFVPAPTVVVEWTTPVFLSGYVATNSFSAVILQFFSIVVGVLIYFPFLKMFEKSQVRGYKTQMSELLSLFKNNEAKNIESDLNRLPGVLNSTVKMLSLDLKYALHNNLLDIYYQPQFDVEKKLAGAEALLRWNHEIFGSIYPPLIIKIAEENDLLSELEKYVFKHVHSDICSIDKFRKSNIYISINLTAKTLQEPETEKFLADMSKENDFVSKRICIEITEQSALNITSRTNDILKNIHNMGYLLAIDDFSMGHTSLKYLKENYFDVVKLDGSLVKEIDKNERCLDIVKSIVYLSQSLGFSVLAEYVETDNDMENLKNVGCKLFQGWLYSRAITYDDFVEFIDCHEISDKELLNAKQ